MPVNNFQSIYDLVRRIPGSKKATDEMVLLQCIVACFAFVNFFRIQVREGDYSTIYPSFLVLLEAPSGSGKGESTRFLNEVLFEPSWSFGDTILRQEEEAYIKAQIDQLMADYTMKNDEGEEEFDEKAFNKAKSAFLGERRGLNCVHFDDGSYEGFAFERAWMSRMRVGFKHVISNEFGDRMKAMERNTHLLSMFSRLYELIDKDVLGEKIVKNAKDSTPGSDGMGTLLYLTYAHVDKSVKERMKHKVLNTLGRRGLLLRAGNGELRFKSYDPISPMEVERVQDRLYKIFESLAHRVLDLPKDKRLVLDFSQEGQEFYDEYTRRYEERMNVMYENYVPSEEHDVEIALMQDINRKVLKMGAVLAVINHGDIDGRWYIEKPDLEQAAELMERFMECARNFFDDSSHTPVNALIAYLNNHEWVSAREILDTKLLTGVSQRGFQDTVRDIMLRDVAIEAEKRGYKLDHKTYNRQDQYMLRPMEEKERAFKAFTEKTEALRREEEPQSKTIEYQFSYLDKTKAHYTEGYEVAPLDKLIEQLKKPYHYSAVEFKDGKRLGSNFVRANLIIIDVDDSFTLDEAKAVFKDYWAIIATTRSHQKPKKSQKYGKGHVCDRFRIILKSDIEFTNGEDFKRVMKKVLPMVNADTQTIDTARFYWGNEESQIIRTQKEAAFPASLLLKQAKAEEEEERKKKYVKANGPVPSSSKGNGTIDSMPLDRTGKGDFVDAATFISGLPADGGTVPVCCPWHDDKNPSAFVSHQPEGGFQITCAGCDRTEWIKPN